MSVLTDDLAVDGGVTERQLSRRVEQLDADEATAADRVALERRRRALVDVGCRTNKTVNCHGHNDTRSWAGTQNSRQLTLKY